MIDGSDWHAGILAGASWEVIQQHACDTLLTLDGADFKKRCSQVQIVVVGVLNTMEIPGVIDKPCWYIAVKALLCTALSNLYTAIMFMHLSSFSNKPVKLKGALLSLRKNMDEDGASDSMYGPVWKKMNDAISLKRV